MFNIELELRGTGFHSDGANLNNATEMETSTLSSCQQVLHWQTPFTFPSENVEIKCILFSSYSFPFLALRESGLVLVNE